MSLTEQDTSCVKPVFLEFKSSGLALLMRGLANDMQSLKESLNKGHTFPSNLKLDYTEILTTDVTDPSVKTEGFESMSKSFLFQVEDLKKDGNFTPEKYNLIIQSCSNCHQQYCPGPLVRINKLKI